MKSYILAGIICALSIVALYLEVKAQGQRAVKTIGWWCGALGLVAGLALFIITNRDQQAAEAKMTLLQSQQAAELKAVRTVQEESATIQKQQRSDLEAIINSQQEALLQAKEAAKAQAKAEEAQANIIQLQRGQNQLQKDQIKILGRLSESQQSQIQLLKRAYNLSGIEISFKPSDKHWDLVAGLYGKLKSPQQDMPYSAVVMVAEREGKQKHWDISFKGTHTRGGVVQLPSVSTADDANKAFEDVINAASLGLTIIWGNGTVTTIEPMTNKIDQLPSAIKVSREEITLTLRPPQVVLNFNDLDKKREITLRGRHYVHLRGQNYDVRAPNSFRVTSLDPNVELNQIIQTNWKVKYDGTFLSRSQSLISGPHTLQFRFTFVEASPAKASGATR